MHELSNDKNGKTTVAAKFCWITGMLPSNCPLCLHVMYFVDWVSRHVLHPNNRMQTLRICYTTFLHCRTLSGNLIFTIWWPKASDWPEFSCLLLVCFDMHSWKEDHQSKKLPNEKCLPFLPKTVHEFLTLNMQCHYSSQYIHDFLAYSFILIR
jgi:hypothetical protein